MDKSRFVDELFVTDVAGLDVVNVLVGLETEVVLVHLNKVE